MTGSEKSAGSAPTRRRPPLKKYFLAGVVVLILFLLAFGDKMKNEKQLLDELKYSDGPGPAGMLRVSERGHTFDIDIYEFPNRAGSLPHGDMTFAAAEQACKSAGKRLCTDEEWTAACAGPRLHVYSYGDKFSHKSCNSIHSDLTVKPSGSLKRCRTESGLYDVSGNLWEWVARSDTGAMLAKGGSYRDGELSQRCSFSFKLFPVQEKHLSFDNFGVRCCKDADPAAAK